MAKSGLHVHERRHASSQSGNERSGAFWRVRSSASRQSRTLSVTIRHTKHDITFWIRCSEGPIYCFGVNTTYVRGQLD